MAFKRSGVQIPYPPHKAPDHAGAFFISLACGRHPILSHPLPGDLVRGGGAGRAGPGEMLTTTGWRLSLFSAREIKPESLKNSRLGHAYPFERHAKGIRIRRGLESSFLGNISALD